MKHKHLLFRRQYLLTTRKCEAFSDWQCDSLGWFYLYVHPDVELSVAARDDNNSKMALIRYMIDPHHPERSNIQILNDILRSSESIDDISDHLMKERHILDRSP